MTTHIKLDTNAVNALFPDGSEARVKLQQCVLVNIAKAQIGSIVGSDFRTAVRNETANCIEPLKKEIESACKESVTSSWSSSVKLLDKTKSLINDAVADEVTSLVNNYRIEQVKIRTKKAMREMESRIDVLVSEKVNYLTVQAVDTKVKQKLSSIVESLKE